MATPRKAAKKASSKKSGSQSKKAGLIFPVGRVGSLLRRGQYARRVGAFVEANVVHVDRAQIDGDAGLSSALHVDDAGRGGRVTHDHEPVRLRPRDLRELRAQRRHVDGACRLGRPRAGDEHRRRDHPPHAAELTPTRSAASTDAST